MKKINTAAMQEEMKANESYIRAMNGEVTLAAEILDKATPAAQEWLLARLREKIAHSHTRTRH